ncbi:DUF1573 domain-containing protein [Flaviramulus sp. BrNp1-15]|uniref:DUF1573 domain-containing protein n=1 Tax=Flaviramulus sp. BrNp1-15 TaxID=2916754 RepID=UPI001EE7A0B5|nr:DUF1573 domain-containing protein [Flaviramulus sp. BrNp1-15]ULC59982.1 DUF1573 domain-containing protein [Flaviramulus sp. BrNp1-15]
MNKFKVLFFIILLSSCKDKVANKYELITEIKIENNEINFGEISITDTLFKTIRVKNTGKNLLVIDSIGASCGCTIVNYDKAPRKFNEIVELSLRFIPYEKGQVNKSIIIDANTDPPFNILYLKGEVK